MMRIVHSLVSPAPVAARSSFHGMGLTSPRLKLKVLSFYSNISNPLCVSVHRHSPHSAISTSQLDKRSPEISIMDGDDRHRMIKRLSHQEVTTVYL